MGVIPEDGSWLGGSIRTLEVMFPSGGYRFRLEAEYNEEHRCHHVSRYSTHLVQVATVDSDPCVVPSLVLQLEAVRCKTGRGDSRNFYNRNIGPSPRNPSLKQGRFLWDPYHVALLVHEDFHYRQLST